MKKITLVFVLVCLALGASAQEKKLTIQKVKKGEEPGTVMNAIKTDFPGAITKDLSFLPAKLYGEEWNVNVQGDELGDVKYYQVNMKEKNRDYVAVYDANGKLLSSKQIVHDVKLPLVVVETLNKFAGWHIDKTHEIIKYSGNQASDTYRVKLQKGVEHKIVYLDANGNIINTRLTVI